MSFLSKLFKPKVNKVTNDTEALHTSIAYCTPENLIILIQYSPKYFTSMIEFADACYRSGIRIIYANSAIEKELSEEESKEFSKKTVTLVDHRYYALISGSIAVYPNLYRYIHSLSNDILEDITKDIYDRCPHREFSSLIDDGIISKSLFKHQQLEPKYDNYVTLNRGTVSYHDDIQKIKSAIPVCFSGLDLLELIKVHSNNTVLRSYSYANEIIKHCYAHGTNNESSIAIYNTLIDTLYKHAVKNPTLEVLSVITQPMYMRVDIEDDVNNGDIPLEQLDEIFQQSYERFENPIDGEYEYEDIDEQLSSEPIYDDEE